MFGWFAPKCPIDLKKKVWIEHRFRWLADKLGYQRLIEAQVLLPTEEHFPDPYQSDLAGINTLADRLKKAMQVTSPIELSIGPAKEMGEALGLYHSGSPARIAINEVIVPDGFATVGTLTHELAHEILLGGGLLTGEEPDHELVTDLLMIFLGVGIIAANETVKSKAWKEGNLEFFQISKAGYLSAMEFGYALAVFAFHRGEQDPTWANYLRHDAAAVLKQGLRFLRKSGDTMFHPERRGELFTPATAQDASEWLRTGTPSRQLLTLWKLIEKPIIDDELRMLLQEKLRHREGAIGESAALALGALGKAGLPAVPALLGALAGHVSLVRRAAARALGELHPEPRLILPALTMSLLDDDLPVAAAAAESLATCGESAREAVPTLIRAIDGALHRHSGDRHIHAVRMIHALQSIAPDAAAQVEKFFEEGNDEHRDYILEVLHPDQASVPEESGTEEPAD